MGFARGDKKRFDEILKENISQAKLRNNTENIRGVDCYVIDADLQGRGDYHIWIDPEHDYHIVKMEINRKGDDNDHEFGDPIDKGCYTKQTYEVFSFEKYGDEWFPKELKILMDTDTFHNPRMDDRSLTFTNVIFNPDFDALDIFKPDFIENGSKVDILETVEGKTVSAKGDYQWKDGKVVDSYGYEVNLSNLKQTSLVGKTLPSVAEFGVDLNSDVFKNNQLFICFFDYSQRPSRNCVLTLNEIMESLLDKDIFLIFIQAESINEQTLNNWLRKNEIVPPVGLSNNGLPELGYSWGIQSLPWLILTDRQHIVTAEGFSIANLDEKLDNNPNN